MVDRGRKDDLQDDLPRKFREGYSGDDPPEGAEFSPPQEPPAWVPEKDDAAGGGEGLPGGADQDRVQPED